MARVATFVSALVGSSLMVLASGPVRAQMNPGCDPATKKCLIKVHVMGTPPHHTFRFDPNNADVDKNDLNSEYCISWQLQGGYVFNVKLGDGVFFKDYEQDQFYDNDTTEDSDCGPTKHGSDVKRYRWRYLNTIAMQTFPYKVYFHKKGEAYQYYWDPTISNTGGH